MSGLDQPPRAVTQAEAREIFLDSIRANIQYWASNSRVANSSHRERLEGLAHSILCIFDGVSGSMPCAIDLRLRPHPDDKQFCIDGGNNWIEDGMVINEDCHLHEIIHRKDPT